MDKGTQAGAMAQQLNQTRKVFAMLPLWLAAGFIVVFLGRIYLVQEFLFFLGLSVFLAFFVANLLILAILVHTAAQFILQAIRKAKPDFASPVEATRRQDCHVP